MTRVAALAMYDLPETRGATDALWAGIARALRAEGVREVPDALDRERSFEEPWRDPALLFAQICGYPMTHAFAGRTRLVATPCHALAGCEGGEYRSLVVVGERSAVGAVDDLRGAVVAVNDHASHSGKHALFAHVAPHAASHVAASAAPAGEPFFADVRVTGSHAASLAAVARGDADVAAIDCITHALLERHSPRALEGTRVLTATAFAPAPPYVTRAAATDDDVLRLRAALAGVFDDPSLACARDALLLRGVRVLGEAEYARIVDVERAHATRRVAPAPRSTFSGT